MSSTFEESTSEEEEDTGKGKIEVAEAVPTKETAEPSTTMKNRIFSSQARFMARKPLLCFWVVFVTAAALSVVGLYLGDFQVTADNAGWQTRGTLIANRNAQVLLVLFNRKRLFDEGDVAWEDLVNNVQPGWESDEDEGARRKLSQSEVDFQPVLDSRFPRRAQSFALTEFTERRLQEAAFLGVLEDCDVSW